MGDRGHAGASEQRAYDVCSTYKTTVTETIMSTVRGCGPHIDNGGLVISGTATPLRCRKPCPE